MQKLICKQPKCFANCELQMANSNTGDYLLIWTCKKKVALRDIAKMEKSQFFVLFENEASYEDFFALKCFTSC